MHLQRNEIAAAALSILLATALILVALTSLFGSSAQATNRPHRTLPCIEHAASVVRTNPAGLPAAYRACKPHIARHLQLAGITPKPYRVRAAFATAVANAYAPYGANSMVRGLDGLRAQTVLACDASSFLAAETYARVGGNESDVRMTGWAKGPTGNHEQVWVRDMLLDPTAGLVAAAPFGQVLAGRAQQRVASFLTNDTYNSEVPSFNAQVTDAIQQGAWHSSDLMYRMTLGQSRSYHRALVTAGPDWKQVPIPGRVMTMAEIFPG